MDIPYTVERRADTGVNNVTLGIWLFLASEVMLFGGLFSAYVLLRSGSPDWPAGGTLASVPLGTLNTAILLAGSTLMFLAQRSVAAGLERRAQRLLGITAGLGVVFLGIKALEYAGKIEHGLLPSTSTALAVYFLLTALHAVHIAGGVVATAHLAMSGTCATGGSLPKFAGRVAAAGLYWHFVDAVWLCLFVMLYLV